MAEQPEWSRVRQQLELNSQLLNRILARLNALEMGGRASEAIPPTSPVEPGLASIYAALVADYVRHERPDGEFSIGTCAATIASHAAFSPLRVRHDVNASGFHGAGRIDACETCLTFLAERPAGDEQSRFVRALIAPHYLGQLFGSGE